MNTRALALSALLAGVSLGACTGVNESGPLTLSAVCALTDDCTFAAECAAQYIGTIAFDASQATRLWLPVQVNNRLANNANPADGKVNTNDAHITSFVIAYQGFALASATVAVNYKIDANGVATVGLDLVPPQAGLLPLPAADTQVLAIVKAKGYVEDGSSFETGEFPVAFTYCNGCGLPIPVCVAPSVPTITCGYQGTLPVRQGCAAP